MTPAQAELWQRIKTFVLDEAGSRFPFSRKLAREQAWSPVFTLRAIEEYRRFLFLSVAAGHPVSPSGAVDQVWHLHLTYTRSYWEGLCGRVLGRPLHHVPGQGRPGETAKFGDWYARTLSSYRGFFGEPPADLWPPVTVGAGRHRRVDLRRHWVLAKPRHLGWTAAVSLAGGGLLLAGGCRWLVEAGGGGSIFDLRGPAFLAFYWMLFPAVLAAMVGWRFLLRGPGRARTECPADPYAVAWLAGGPMQATLAAVCALSGRGLAQVNSRDQIAVLGVVPPDAHPLEKALHEDGRRGLKTLKGWAAQTELHGAPLAAELESGGLVLSPAARSRARWRPFWLAMLPVVIGLIKIGVGIARDRPVLFLVLSCCVSLFLAWRLVGRRVWRTRAGEKALRRLRREHAALRRASWPAGAAGAGTTPRDDSLSWAVGLFGLGVLTATPLSGLAPLLAPPRGTPGDSGGGGCGSSCGGGDGGGCGGCGGGD